MKGKMVKKKCFINNKKNGYNLRSRQKLIDLKKQNFITNKFNKCNISISIECKESNNVFDSKYKIDEDTINETIIQKEIIVKQDPTFINYNTNNAIPGYVIIFNHNEFIQNEMFPSRDGSERDVECLKDILEPNNFIVTIYNDLTYKEILSTTYNLENEKRLEETNCIMIFILTHGGLKDNSLMAKDEEYNLYKYIDLFNPQILSSLAGKPKLFFIQACRGSVYNRVVDNGTILKYYEQNHKNDTVDAADFIFDELKESEVYINSFTHPNYADLLIAFSSHHEHYSFRNKIDGSWFIQELCNVLIDENYKYKEITEILTKTNHLVAQKISSSDDKYNQKKQVSAFYSTLVRKFYLLKRQQIVN